MRKASSQKSTRGFAPAIYRCILAHLPIFFNQLSKFLRCESPSTFLGTCLSHHSFIIFLVTNTNTLLSGLYLISALHYAFGLEQCHHYWCQCPLGLIPHFYENTQSSRLVFRFWVSMPSRAYISFLRECVDPAPFAYMEFQCPLGLISHFYLNIELVVNSWQEISMPSRAYISFLRYPFKNLDNNIQCQTPAKKYKLYKSSINKSLHFVQRSLSSSTRVHRVTAQLNLSREWKNRMTTVVISAILNPVSRVSTPHFYTG